MDQTPTPKETRTRRVTSDLRAVIAFMTRLPVDAPHADLARACWAFPVAGLAVGAAGGGILLAALYLEVPPMGAALLALLAGAAFTGALHEDGLADTADGLGSTDSEQRLAIMRDSRIGAYGVLALIFSVGLRAAALSAIVEPWMGFAALLTGAIVSRGLLPGMMHGLPLANTTGLAASVGPPERGAALLSCGLAAAGAILLLGPGMGIGAFAFGAVAVAAMAMLARRMIGGYNGDTLGAAQQSAEIAILTFIAAAL